MKAISKLFEGHSAWTKNNHVVGIENSNDSALNAMITRSTINNHRYFFASAADALQLSETEGTLKPTVSRPAVTFLALPDFLP
eukprot:CAMPEP_0185925444 /NCGR_PEP_ID=MMETSP0924C-20121207/13769_1 /TAXON_ID=321610 /ORGANISM="Perkinsus chesapeaki, Strain ATCC PRA-65" /LENGTH=82 /DNA_ID=CAMNT_0028662157 /DNA_START=243 /DNA_END=487 /DNA_ORIENTATION=-